jgi:membrane protein
MGILIPFLLTLTMFFQLYFFIPKPHPPFKSVFWGALITAIFWELAKSLFTLYASNFAFFNQYRQDSSLGLLALGDTVGLIIAVLLWVYYSGIVLIVGGILVMQLEKRAIKHNTNQETTP